MTKEMFKQKGMTLIELVVALAITATISLGILGLIYHEFNGTAIAKSSVTAACEIENAARLICQDCTMAGGTSLSEGIPEINDITLNWVDRYGFINLPHCSRYYVDGMKLYRDYDGTVSMVADNIHQISFLQESQIITISITCQPPWWKSPAREEIYRVFLRSGGDGLYE